MSWDSLDIDMPTWARGNTKVKCPKCQKDGGDHNPRDKPLSADAATGLFNCHHCGWTGRIQMDGYQPRQPKQYVRPEQPHSHNLSLEWQDWLIKRGITNPIVCERNLLRSEGNVLKFPYFKNQTYINEKSRTRDKSFWLVTDAELIPYGWDDCYQQETVVIVEGEMDKLAIEQATGWTWVLSPPNGSKPDDDVFGKIGEVCAQARRIILAGDMDAVGMAFQETLATRLGLHRCWRVMWPVKDANETLMTHGEERVRQCLAEAIPYPVSGIFTVDDLDGEIDRLYVEGMPRGKTTGWTCLNEFYTVQTKQLTTVTGSPGFGKSSWLDHLLINLATQHEWKFAICSPEMRPLQRHYAGLIQQYVGKPFGE
jgi:twinkle protein